MGLMLNDANGAKREMLRGRLDYRNVRTDAANLSWFPVSEVNQEPHTVLCGYSGNVCDDVETEG